MIPSEKINVLIVGAGTKGALYDYPEDPVVLSHAHAFTENPAFNLLGFHDTNAENAVEAVRRWGGNHYWDLHEAFGESRVDVVSLCVPDESHEVVLEKLSKINFSLLFCEKPFTTSLESAKKAAALFNPARTPILVNYPRRFNPSFQYLKTQIKTEGWGQFLGGAGFYGKSIIHNGSHAVDLLNFWGIEDPLPLINLDRSHVNAFEMVLFFKKLKIQILDHGNRIETTPYSPRNGVPQDFVLDFLKKLSYPTFLAEQAMRGAVQNVADFLNQKADLLCTVNDAIRVHERILRDYPG